MNGYCFAIKVSPKDNVATLLHATKAGRKVTLSNTGEEVITTEDCPSGHKIALEDVKKGQFVFKYGEVIGYATEDISKGSHVHVHNMASLRGRGDEDVHSLQRNTQPSTVSHGVAKEEVIDISLRTFMGYRRADGSVGVRNYVGVVSTVACANEAAIRIAAEQGCPCFTHQQGCSQTKPDIDKVLEVLINLAKNPNLGALLYVYLGCESVPISKLEEEVAKIGKPLAFICIQEEGGLSKTVLLGSAMVGLLKTRIEGIKREEFSVSELKVGLKCGSSDTTQGLSANVVIGMVTDSLVRAGASVVIGETTEFMGAEHIAAKNAQTEEIGQEIISSVIRMEDRAKAVGVDMRGGQPTRGNIEGGLTTIEEKSLGALAKAGTSRYSAFIDYGSRTDRSGLIFMDSPGREPEMLTGLAASGCNLILFSTGRGAPQGFPFVPVIKITGNSKTAKLLSEHIDISVSGVIDGTELPESAARRLIEKVFKVADGSKTKAEVCGYSNSMNIYVRGPVI